MDNKNIIVVDDDRSIRLVLTTALSRSGFNVKSSATAAGLWRLLETENVDILITDVGLPDGDTLDILPKVQKLNPELKIIVISAKSTLITAVRAQKKGAFHYLPKPFDLDEIISLVTKIANSKFILPSIDDNSEIIQKKQSIYDSGPIIGKSKIMQDTYKLIARVVTSNLSILISGESGTGKKLVARAIHDLSEYSKKPFVKVTMNEFKLINSNHKYRYDNNVENVLTKKLSNLNGGTLFIDEVADGDLDEQTELLKLLESDNFIELTNSNNEKIMPRVITSTRRNIIDLVKNGLFRDDLFYKINVIPINLPPLRDRLEDIPYLSEHFIKIFSSNQKNAKEISESGIHLMQKYHWPGNVQELKNFVERLCLTNPDKLISYDIIEAILNSDKTSENLVNDDITDEYLDKFVEKKLTEYKDDYEGDLHQIFVNKIEKPLITNVLNITRGNQIRAAQLLGFNRNTLRKKIKDLQIQVKKVRKNSIKPTL